VLLQQRQLVLAAMQDNSTLLATGHRACSPPNLLDANTTARCDSMHMYALMVAMKTMPSPSKLVKMGCRSHRMCPLQKQYSTHIRGKQHSTQMYASTCTHAAPCWQSGHTDQNVMHAQHHDDVQYCQQNHCNFVRHARSGSLHCSVQQV
jgi:hypothetical protein